MAVVVGVVEVIIILLHNVILHAEGHDKKKDIRENSFWYPVIDVVPVIDVGCLKFTKAKATNMGHIRTRGSYFNSNADLKIDARVVFQLKRELDQVEDAKVTFNTKRGSRVDHQNESLGSFAFQLKRGSE